MATLRYRAVLFDLDGTLVDSYTALADAINHARAQHGLDPLAEGTIRGLVGDGVQKLLERAFDSSVPSTAQEEFEQRYDAICCEQSHVLADVESTLQSLHAAGVKMAVCTNKPTGFSAKILAHLGIVHHFASVVGPDLAGARKPDPRHLLHALMTTGCAATEALFVGDMPIDVRTARNAGLDIAVIASGSSTADELRASRPDYFLERFPDLIGVAGVLRREIANR
jgi:2-phosphoglycolate phosphatase